MNGLNHTEWRNRMKSPTRKQQRYLNKLKNSKFKSTEKFVNDSYRETGERITKEIQYKMKKRKEELSPTDRIRQTFYTK